MNTKHPTTLRTSWLGVVLLGLSLPVQAGQFGLFHYQVFGGTTVAITGYPRTATGPVEIPAEIAGLPVTCIYIGVFLRCTFVARA